MQLVCRLVLRAAANRRGLALIEFALSAPVLLTLVLFGIETANIAIATLRVHQIAATTADNVGRVRDSISESDVGEALLGGVTIGANMKFADRGRIVVSDVMANGKTSSNAGQTIFWQRCTGKLNTPASQPAYGAAGKGANDATLQLMGRPGRQIAPTAGSTMIFVEVTYKYLPIVSANIFGTPTLRSEAAFTVRERNSETLLAGAPGSDASVCTRYDL